MFENVTIGDLSAAALGTGFDAVTKGAGGQVLADAYQALKELVCLRCPNELASLEELPHSVARRGIVGFILDCRPDEYKAKLRVLVENLIIHLKAEGPASGVDISYLMLLEIHFNKPKVIEAEVSQADKPKKPAKVKKEGVRLKKIAEFIEANRDTFALQANKTAAPRKASKTSASLKASKTSPRSSNNAASASP